MPDFLSVILRKEGGAGSGISVPIIKVNIGFLSSGDESLPHVSGSIAAFHSDLGLDKPKRFLKITIGISSRTHSFCLLPLFLNLFHTSHWFYGMGRSVCCSVHGSASPGTKSFRFSGCGFHGGVGLTFFPL